MDFDFLSAKTGDNIHHVFTKVGRYVYDYRETQSYMREMKDNPGSLSYEYGIGESISPRGDGLYYASSWNGTE